MLVVAVGTEFQCLSFIQTDDIKPEQLLLTRSMDGRSEFNCWVSVLPFKKK